MKQQLARMHKHFGRERVHKCGECCNYTLGIYGTGRLAIKKCHRHGADLTRATDWDGLWPACKKFNVPLEDGERPLMEYVDRRRGPEGAIPGQISLLDLEPAP